MSTPAIDQTRCTACGLCIRLCPSDALGLVHGKTGLVKESCIGCGHCLALCPVQAVEMDHGAAAPTFSGFGEPPHVQPGGIDPALVAGLMLSRRSQRDFDEQPVPLESLRDLVAYAVTAPSGTNSQRWTFTLLKDRAAVLRLAAPIRDFFAKLNSMADNPVLPTLMRLVGRPELAVYKRDYRDSVAKALAEWEATGRDRLFHHAPAAILVGSKPGASCPAEDALLATQNLCLGAHALGLSTCLIGYAVAAIKEETKVKAALGLPADETVHAVIAVGYGRAKFQRPAVRRTPLVREL